MVRNACVVGECRGIMNCHNEDINKFSKCIHVYTLTKNNWGDKRAQRF